MGRFMDSIKTKYRIILITLFLIIFVWVNYFIYSINISPLNSADLILQNSWSEPQYEDIFVKRIKDNEDINYIESLVEKVVYVTYSAGEQNQEIEREVGFYRFKDTTTREQISKVKTILYENGYYGDLASVGREVETYQKDSFNGKYGQFFRFKFLGNIIWLSIPLIVYLLISKWRSINKWQIAVFVVTLLGYIATYKHGYNYRYQATLIPILLLFVIVGFYYVLDLKRNKLLKYLFCGFLLLSYVVNIYLGFVYKVPIPVDPINNNTGENKVDISPENQDIKNTENIFANYENAAKFINSLELDENKKFFVNNLTFFHYYTNKPGILFWIYGDYYFAPEGKVYGIIGDKNNAELNNFLTQDLNIQYIISRKDYNMLNARFDEYLNKMTTQIYNDGNILIYRLDENNV
jgi:hypothetical protein